MLEMLLETYKNQFDEDFPLASFAGTPEIEVINIIYSCLQSATPYSPGDGYSGVNLFPDAPGMKK